MVYPSERHSGGGSVLGAVKSSQITLGYDTMILFPDDVCNVCNKEIMLKLQVLISI